MPLKNSKCNPALDLEVDAPFSADEWFGLTVHQRAEIEAADLAFCNAVFPNLPELEFLDLNRFKVD